MLLDSKVKIDLRKDVGKIYSMQIAMIKKSRVAKLIYK